MKTRSTILTGVLMSMLLCAPALAQQNQEIKKSTVEDSRVTQRYPKQARAPRDCSQAPNPAACAARQEARAKSLRACQGKAGQERRQCMRTRRSNVDCNTRPNPQRCEARKQAYKACANEAGRAIRSCMQEKLSQIDCSTSPNPQRCEMHRKAREACKDKLGPEHRSCLRAQFPVN